jgi:hypothetical protein
VRDEVVGLRSVAARLPRARGRLLLVGLVGAVACGGSAFSNKGSGAEGDASGGRGSAGLMSSAAGAGELGGGAGGEVGGIAAGGKADAGTGGEGAADSGGNVLTCAELDGLDYADHCYVDVTTDSVNQLGAVAGCDALAARAGRAASLLVLGTPEEQAFVIGSFLSETTDAWLALTCSSAAHPVLTDCYCQDCEDGLLLEKRGQWSWADGSAASFGWSGNNPDGAVRCSALAYNQTISTWGWVDRSCLSTTHRIDDLAPHRYRVICELPEAP